MTYFAHIQMRGIERDGSRSWRDFSSARGKGAGKLIFVVPEKLRIAGQDLIVLCPCSA